MSTFRTIVPLPSSFPKLNHENRLLAIGSCFASEIGGRLNQSKFNILINPSGILYNPLSIAQLLNRSYTKQLYEEDLLFEHQGFWHSYAHHSSFSKPVKADALQLINEQLENTFEFTDQGTHLLLTLGTANVYALQSSGKVVANCHKMPAAHFIKKRLDINVIVDRLGEVLARLKQANPKLKIIITVSPVKHLRDGILENNLSKATLLLASQQLCDQLPDTYYFPAYEILTDELRDYRFYASDMAHPSEMAVDYIWSRFCELAFDETSQSLIKKIDKILAATQHRPFHPASTPHQQFIRKQLSIIADLERDYPLMNWSTEKELLSRSMMP